MMGTDSLVWHYTNGAGLKGILENKVLWASSAAYLNDVRELVSGSDRLREMIGELDEEYAELRQELEKRPIGYATPRHECFILSACKDGDSLTMWRYYGKDEVSFAVGLDAEVQLGARAQKDGRSHPFPPPAPARTDILTALLSKVIDFESPSVGRWDAMVYEPDEQKRILAKALSELRQAHDEVRRESAGTSLDFMRKQRSLFNQSNRIKDYGFRDEQELRVFAEAAPSWKYVLHRPGRFGLIPYIELGLPKGGASGRNRDFSDGGPQMMDRLPIRQINIGPTLFPEEAKFGLLQLLSFLGYHDVEVSVSPIPYR